MAEGLNDTLLNIMAQAGMDAAVAASLHTATPDATGSNESTAARQTISWDVAANGDMILTTDENFTGGAASGACVAVGLWNQTTVAGSTFYGYFLLDGDQTFNAAGEYTLTGITITGSSSGV